ncbi:MAG: 1-pyrroline-5-carboxylate dehydrogenase [Ramalina farinacea]|uniref:Multifunctional fusion protein n=1 Tax=Ramalina farinacea TaxID=258253 RepID=A0AA43QSZ8_9LECA|nr:1-pyrroline-5-carboxylate dehydrogenase [Ramalina farinacea]
MAARNLISASKTLRRPLAVSKDKKIYSLSNGSAQLARIATYKVPKVENENNKHYAKGSPDRKALAAALAAHKEPREVHPVISGKAVQQLANLRQANPASHKDDVANYSNASTKDVSRAIEAALAAKPSWEAMAFHDRAAIFLKAADLIAGKYRYEIMAATMLGQGKNAWQAEIDAAAELCDFLRFNVQYAQDLYAQQPVHNAPGVWNRVEYRPLEGFVYAISPFNFTAIGGNLPGAPALMGNVVLWKPSPSAISSNSIIYKILLEAGLPPNVIQFVPGDAQEVTSVALAHRDFSSLHYTGSTAVFRSLYGTIANNVANGTYRGYPRIVGETGGKNFHLLHPSADPHNAVINTIRGAFEYQGQKCSATSRAYIPSSLWPVIKPSLIEQTNNLQIGPPTEFENFIGPVIHRGSFDKLRAVIDAARSDPQLELLVGGTHDDSEGYYIHPTICLTTNPTHPLLSTELFGPILVVYVYNDEAEPDAFAKQCQLIDRTSDYALTGSVFAQDREAAAFAERALRNCAGNFYVNCKSTGAVVGQQPFGGARASGTNDKAGSPNLLSRFVSMRSIKEDFVGSGEVAYPSNEV